MQRLGINIGVWRPDCKDSNSKFTNHKWAMPRYMWGSDNYPDSTSGSGYVIPISAVTCLYVKGLDTAFVFLEDIFVTGILRTKCGVGLRDNADFYFIGKELCKFNWRKDLLVHYVKSRKSMEKLHGMVVAKNSTTCAAK